MSQSREKNDLHRSQKRSDNLNGPMGRIAWGLSAALIVTVVAKLVIEVTIGQSIPAPLYVIPGIAVALIFIVRAWTAKELRWSHDWKVLSMVANSKALRLITVALTIVPIVLSTSQAIDRQYMLPFDLYLYWISGLSVLSFLLVYKATAPTVFKYPSYRDLIDREGSVRVLRNSLAELKHLAAARKEPFSLARGILIPDSDFYAIRKLDIDDARDQEHIYFVALEYAKYLKPVYRAILTAMLMLPLFIALTITLNKIQIVAIQANETAHCYNGWIKATYWNMLKTNQYFLTPQKIERTQKCLHELSLQR